MRTALPLLCVATATGCWQNSDSRNEDRQVAATAQSCMSCHNGSSHNDYAGPGMENPHPFNGGGTLLCTECHGGNGEGADMLASHVPPPPEIGDRDFRTHDNEAYFNRLTLVGLDTYADYTVNGVTYTALDYLKFVNPGDLRVTTEEEGCGSCHAPHSDLVSHSLLATSAGILSGALFAVGVESVIPDSVNRYQNTAADLAFRPVIDPDFVFDANRVGAVSELAEFPVFSVVGQNGADDIFENPAYDAAALTAATQLEADGRVVNGSPLANLMHEQVAFTCGNCHLGSAGANNRYGDFRSSGCTACHMRSALDGRDNSTDPNINKLEPLNVDQIAAPERPHVDRHVIRSVAQTLQSGETLTGIDDYTCAGCHQGSNRTVLQFWGIRLDQNQDLKNVVQYPTQPVTYTNTANDTRLFDPVVNNQTFNGRNVDQYILAEDYDGDGRDDTPADVHYAAGMGCIDCHGSHDLHGGSVTDPSNERILSRQEQGVAIQCEDCHGTAENYASIAVGADYNGVLTDLVTDSEGNLLRHVRRTDPGEFFLTSRLTGNVHYIPQTKDVVTPSTKINPLTGEQIYNAKASYAMGRDDGDPTTGLGPQQVGSAASGFSHGDNMSCVSCHASWTNNCIGCHLKGEYDDGNNRFSNITGEQIVFNEANADFVYQSPVMFQLGVDSRGKISPMAGNTDMWFQWFDEQGDASEIFTFSTRNAQGTNPAQATNPAMNHNAMMPHSIRGKVDGNNEGPRYCVACHLTQDAITNFGPQYDAFRTAMATDDFASLDFNLLATEIGANPGNQRNSPFWVHMVAGLGSGLFLFDEDGCAVNPLDTNANRVGCDDAPANLFNPANVRYNLDRIVNADGTTAGGNNHAFIENAAQGNALRSDPTSTGMSGPLGQSLLEALTDPNTGIVLDSWINANGELEGSASTIFTP